MSASYVCLSEVDRARLGCPDRMKINLMDITAREQATVQEAFGFHTPGDISDAFMAMFSGVEDGKINEDTVVRRDPNFFLAATWLALRQNGLLTARRADEMAVELADLDIQISRVQLDFDQDAEGKDDSSTLTETSTA